MERILLTVEGGDKLDKNISFLDECNLKDGATLILEIADKSVVPSRPKKPTKEEPKYPVQYSVRALYQEGEEPVTANTEVTMSTKLK